MPKKEITGHDDWVITEALATALVALEQLEAKHQPRKHMDDIRKLLAAGCQQGTVNLHLAQAKCRLFPRRPTTRQSTGNTGSRIGRSDGPPPARWVPAPAPPGPLPCNAIATAAAQAIVTVPLRSGSRFRPVRSSESRRARHLSNAQSDIFDMRQIIIALALLYPAAALAQGTSQGAAKDAAPPAATSTPPTVGGNPLVQVGKKPAGKKSEAARQAEIGRAEAAGLPGDRRRDQGAADLLRRHLRAAAEAEAARRKGGQ